MSCKNISSHVICGAVFLVATLGSQVQAGVFKCVGDDGKVFYNDKPCPFEDRETEMEMVAKQNVMQSETPTPVVVDIPLPLPSSEETEKKEAVVRELESDPDTDSILSGMSKPKRAASVDEDDAAFAEELAAIKEEMHSGEKRSENEPMSPKGIEEKAYDKLYGKGADVLSQGRVIPDAVGSSNQTDG